MANFNIRMYSDTLKRTISFIMYIPNDKRPPIPGTPVKEEKPIKTMFLLHGYTGDAFNWIPEWVLEEHDIALVIPNGENGFWLDGLSTGHKYDTFVAIELMDYVRKTFNLALTAEDTSVMGFSMGGFGALHFGLAHPDRFSKVFALSSANIVKGLQGMTEETENPVANYAYYHECFGDLNTVLERDTNPEVLVKKLKEAGTKIPDIYMACGTEDSLIHASRELHEFLDKENVKHVYLEGPGIHDMNFWEEYAKKFIDMAF